VQILSHTVKEELPAIILVVNDTFTFDCRSHGVDNVVYIFSREQISNFTRRKQIINEDEEAFIGDLTFGEQEHDTFVFLSSFDIHLLQIDFKISETVGRGNDNSHGLEHADCRAKS